MRLYFEWNGLLSTFMSFENCRKHCEGNLMKGHVVDARITCLYNYKKVQNGYLKFDTHVIAPRLCCK